jgi:single-strand DNA-binding protein
MKKIPLLIPQEVITKEFLTSKRWRSGTKYNPRREGKKERNMSRRNVVCLDGNIGKAPTLRMTQAGTPILSWSLGVNDSYRNQAGERQDRTDWFRCVIFGKRARALSEVLVSGHSIGVDGRLTSRSWVDQNGVRQYRTEVRVSDVHFLGPRKGGRLPVATLEVGGEGDPEGDPQLPLDPDDLVVTPEEISGDDGEGETPPF